MILPAPTSRRRTAHRCARAIVTTALALWAHGARAQQYSPARPPLGQPSGALTFTRIDQTVADVDPLRVSLRHLSTDLRQPTGFSDIFRIEGSQSHLSRYGFSTTPANDLLARVDGAVTAVFPQSVYIPTREGIVPLIPPGTVFFIGGIPADFFASPDAAPPPPTFVNSRIDQRADASSPPVSWQPPGVAGIPPPPSGPRQPTRRTDERLLTAEPTRVATPAIMTDEPLRRSMVRGLIMKAADAVHARTEVPRAGTKPDDAPPENKAAPAKPER